MKIEKFFEKKDLSDSFVLGYYGGGNFGDELLLEVVMGILNNKNYTDSSFFYSAPDKFLETHKDYGFKLVDGRKKSSVFYNLLKHKNIILGGGGLWGCDFSKNTFFLTLVLYLLSFFRKNIYCVGVGHYNSTNRLGRISAFLISKATKSIIARDKESLLNFKKFDKGVSMDRDIAFSYQLANHKYESKIEKNVGKISKNTVILGLRRFRNEKTEENWRKMVERIIKENPKITFLLSLFEFEEVDPSGKKFIEKMNRKYKNIRPFYFNYNPLELIEFLKINSRKLKVICPQYHLNLIAHLANVEFFPVTYDNKSAELFESIGAGYENILDDDLCNKINRFLK